MRLTTLGTEDPRWLALWESWDLREPFAHPTFARLFAAPGERPLALVGKDEGGTVLFPLMERDVPDQAAKDLSNPYGYGGPYRIGEPDAEAFWREARDWASDKGYVSLFSRLSLQPEHLALGPVESSVVQVQPNVVRSLDLGPEAMWADYDHTTRYNVRRARAAGLTVDFDEEGRNLDAFLEIYAETMERNEAGAYYRFAPDLFRTLVREMPGAFVFPNVWDGDRIVSTELTLRSRDTIFSFLGGTRTDAFRGRPNHLLKHELIAWGRDHGYREYVLGGGVATPENGGEDGIYKYKLAFAPHGRREFSVLRLTLDPDRSDALVAARQSESSWVPHPGFFPPYRS